MKNRENLLRKVYGVDTKAGHALRRQILLGDCGLSTKVENDSNLIAAFIWEDSEEGHDYWSRINKLLSN
jgi:hypothetical protein